MAIHKIFRASEWEAMQSAGETLGAPVDIADGFVHFSTAETLRETVARHFAGEDGLWLVTAEEGRMAGDLRWEVSRGGALFPHLYRPFRLTDVIAARPLPLVDGRHVFPELA
ncbi:MAG: DUF952 domain-containing protein [Rubellimicrobium sp.]|nr:DUF952 domain-containing protein [Rubellimicrobium sp.]